MPPQKTSDEKSYRRTMSNRLPFVVIGSPVGHPVER
jgi:hypothetical protein